MQRALIAPLTGIRAFAAFWVFLRHFRVEIVDALPWTAFAVPIMNVGYLGVDLFFILSGFILTVSYVGRFARGWSTRRLLGFLWLRIARIWPLTVFVLLIYALYFLVRAFISGDFERLAALDPGRFLIHSALLQSWYPHSLDWNGVDWSISAEWMAYLTFAIGVIVLARVAVAGKRGILIGTVFALCIPLMVIGSGTQDGTILIFSPDSYVLSPGLVALRVLSEFWAGAFLAILLRPYIDRETPPVWAKLWAPTVLAIASVAAIWVIAVNDPARWTRPGEVTTHNGIDWISTSETILVLPLFVLLIGSLAICRRDPLARLLATKPLVLGGKVSYAFYLSHALVIGAAALVLAHVGTHSALSISIVILTAVAAWVFAWVLWRVVENPARNSLRRLLPDSATP